MAGPVRKDAGFSGGHLLDIPRSRPVLLGLGRGRRLHLPALRPELRRRLRSRFQPRGKSRRVFQPGLGHVRGTGHQDEPGSPAGLEDHRDPCRAVDPGVVLAGGWYSVAHGRHVGPGRPAFSRGGPHAAAPRHHRAGNRAVCGVDRGRVCRREQKIQFGGLPVDPGAAGVHASGGCGLCAAVSVLAPCGDPATAMGRPG